MQISEAINISLLLELSQCCETQNWDRACEIIEEQIGRAISNRARASLELKLKIYQRLASGTM